MVACFLCGFWHGASWTFVFWEIQFSAPLLLSSNTNLRLVSLLRVLEYPTGRILLLLFSIMFLASGTFNPFIYFRF